MSEEQNPILGYADSYRLMVQMAEKECQPLVVSLWSVITDLERNMAPLMSAALSREASLIAENERLVTQVRLAGVAAEMTVHDAAGRAASDYIAVALERDQLKDEVESLRKSEAALREELAAMTIDRDRFKSGRLDSSAAEAAEFLWMNRPSGWGGSDQELKNQEWLRRIDAKALVEQAKLWKIKTTESGSK